MYRVQPLVILRAVSCLLVEDGARVKYVIHVEISPHLGSAHREGPAETKIQLLDSIIEECVRWNQIDGNGLVACSHRLARACREVPAQRPPDFFIAGHVARRDREPGSVLVRGTDLRFPGQRVDSREFDLRGGSPRLADAAESRSRVLCRDHQDPAHGDGLTGNERGRRINREAVVEDSTPRAQAPLDLRAVSKPRVDENIDTVEDLALPPIVRRLRDEVVDLAELLRLDVVEPAELLATHAGWQSRIYRRRNTEWIVVCRRHGLIVDGQKSAVPGAEIRGSESDIPPQLMLHRDRALPVVILTIEAAQRIGRSARIAAADLAEAEIRPLSTLAVG